MPPNAGGRGGLDPSPGSLNLLQPARTGATPSRNRRAGPLAGRPANGPIATEELAPAPVQPRSRLEQALHILAGGGRVLQGGLDGPELLDVR
jgi:hypothetical protein